MIRSYFSILVLVFAVLTLASGCQKISVRGDDELSSTLLAYESVVRWEGPDKQSQFLKDPGSLPNYSGIRVLGYEVTREPSPVSENLVGQVAKIQYIRTDTQVIRTIEDRQLWEKAAGGKRWLRVNPPPIMTR